MTGPLLTWLVVSATFFVGGLLVIVVAGALAVRHPEGDPRRDARVYTGPATFGVLLAAFSALSLALALLTNAAVLFTPLL